VHHGAEVPYVYNSVQIPDPAEHHLAQNILDYWISFAHCLDPNDGKGTPRTSSPY